MVNFFFSTAWRLSGPGQSKRGLGARPNKKYHILKIPLYYFLLLYYFFPLCGGGGGRFLSFSGGPVTGPVANPPGDAPANHGYPLTRHVTRSQRWAVVNLSNTGPTSEVWGQQDRDRFLFRS